MIKNEKQYKITTKKLNSINQKIAEMNSGGDQLSITNQLIMASLIDIKTDMENEIAAYDLLKLNIPANSEERVIDDLPLLLIEYKINSGLTQKEFSKKIGMKEQQLQRYEADNFKSISFKNLLKILHAIGLEIKIKGSVLGSIT
jgi:DNA-binding Xre family transcriptional regulator